MATTPPRIFIAFDAEHDEGLKTLLVLGGHLKTGHTWPLQNRPTKLSQNKSIYTVPEAVVAIFFS